MREDGAPMLNASEPASQALDLSWEQEGGVACPQCGRNSFRILEGRCVGCLKGQRAKVAKKLEAKAKLRHVLGLQRARREKRRARSKPGR